MKLSNGLNKNSLDDEKKKVYQTPSIQLYKIINYNK